jgi:hypothetical protein
MALNPQDRILDSKTCSKEIESYGFILDTNTHIGLQEIEA